MNYLPAPMLDLLRDGQHPSRTYQSNSEVQGALLLSMAQHGWTVAEAWEEMIDPTNFGGRKVQRKLRTKGRTRTFRWFTQDWNRIERFALEGSTSYRDAKSFAMVIAEIEASIDGHPEQWKGVAGTTDRIVMAVLVDIAKKARSLSFSASVRRVAESASVTKDSVCRSIKRLAEAGLFLSIDAPSQGTKAAVLRLMMPDTPSTEVNVQHRVSQVLTEISDLFSRKGLGLGAAKVYAYLAVDSDMTLDDLVEATGACVATVRKHLRSLALHNLITTVGDCYRRVEATVKELDAMARQLGVPAVRAMRRLLHEQQRMVFEMYSSQRSTRIQESRASRRNWFRACVDHETGMTIDTTTGEVLVAA